MEAGSCEGEDCGGGKGGGIGTDSSCCGGIAVDPVDPVDPAHDWEDDAVGPKR